MKVNINVLKCDFCNKFEHLLTKEDKVNHVQPLSTTYKVLKCDACKKHFCCDHGQSAGDFFKIPLCSFCISQLIARLSKDGTLEKLTMLNIKELRKAKKKVEKV